MFDTLKDGVGRECTLAFGGKRYTTRILGVARHTVWITFPRVNYSLVGTPVDLELGAGRGGPCFHMQVVLESEEPDGGAVLQRTGMLRAQQRMSWRVPVSFMSKVWQGQSKDTHPVHVLDLSIGGALIKTRANLHLGSMAYIIIALPDERPATISCQIIRGAPQPDGTRLYGVMFRNVSPQSNRSLTTYLWKALRERYPEAVQALYPRGAPKPG